MIYHDVFPIKPTKTYTRSEEYVSKVLLSMFLRRLEPRMQLH